jgi:hypothetical protein
MGIGTKKVQTNSAINMDRGMKKYFQTDKARLR